MLQHFFGRAGKTPDQVTSQDVFAWACATGLSGRQPGSITIGSRIACLSSFFRFLIRMRVVASNPCDALERPKISQSAGRGLSGQQISQLLDALPATRVGTPRSRDHPDAYLHGPASRRSPAPNVRKHLRRGRDRLLQLPGQGREDRQDRAAAAGFRGYQGVAGERGHGPGDDAA
jgi:hypothetical protein